jgi:hypothetical protein
MVFYLARCKDPQEAFEIQKKLITTCPTLIYSRVLQKPQDLDVFNAKLLRGDDEEYRPGDVALEQAAGGDLPLRRRMGPLYPWMVLGTVLAAIFFILAGVILAHAIIAGTPTDFGSAVIWAGVFMGLSAIALGATWATSRAAPIAGEAGVYDRVERWLKKGYPVFIAASEGVPDASAHLPRNVIYFDRTSNRVLERSA